MNTTPDPLTPSALEVLRGFRTAFDRRNLPGTDALAATIDLRRACETGGASDALRALHASTLAVLGATFEARYTYQRALGHTIGRPEHEAQYMTANALRAAAEDMSVLGQLLTHTAVAIEAATNSVDGGEGARP